MTNEEKENFISYYNQHYKPLLNRLSENPGHVTTEEERRLLSFLKEDMNKLLGLGSD